MFCELIKRYIQCFPAEQQTGRFLRKLSKIGKDTNRPIGVNMILVYAKNVACLEILLVVASVDPLLQSQLMQELI